jgi:hypothetical protein
VPTLCASSKTCFRAGRAKNVAAVYDLISSVNRSLGQLSADYKGLSLRNKVKRLVEIFKQATSLNVAVARDSGCDSPVARERIRLYLIHCLGDVIDGAELQVVSGITEYGRRVRELRVEFGYKIISGMSTDAESDLKLKASQYALFDAAPDRDAAHRWHIANRIRRASGDSRDRVLAYLKENVGRVVTTEELAYVAKTKEYTRRIRELRTESGYSIATNSTGRPDLNPGEYVLQDLNPVGEQHDRHIPEATARAVYARDRNKCRFCGGSHGDWKRPGAYVLQLHHMEHHKSGGRNNEQNLVTVCNVCHVDVHADRLDASSIAAETIGG